MKDDGNTTNALLTLLATASEERKVAALRELQGEAEQTAPVDRGPEPYQTLKQVAAQVGVSACSLWRWNVPGHELGGRRRFRLSEVVAYLESDMFKARADELKAARRAAGSDLIAGDGVAGMSGRTTARSTHRREGVTADAQ